MISRKVKDTLQYDNDIERAKQDLQFLTEFIVMNSDDILDCRLKKWTMKKFNRANEAIELDEQAAKANRDKAIPAEVPVAHTSSLKSRRTVSADEDESTSVSSCSPPLFASSLAPASSLLPDSLVKSLFSTRTASPTPSKPSASSASLALQDALSLLTARAQDAVRQQEPESAGDPKLETPERTQDLSDDIEVLKKVGFVIDYPDGLLGVGGWCKVYKGRYHVILPGNGGTQAFDRFAVIVFDHLSLTEPERKDARKQIQSEKLISSMVKHPKIAHVKWIVNMGQKDVQASSKDATDRTYLFLELAQGGQLKGWMKERNVPTCVAVKLIRDVFEAVMYLHSIGIAHRDISSKNILMFDKNGFWTAKLSGFGLAYLRDKSQQAKDFSQEWDDAYEWQSSTMLDIFRIAVLIDEFIQQPTLLLPRDWEKKEFFRLKHMMSYIYMRRPTDIFKVFKIYRDIMEVEDDDQPDPELRSPGYNPLGFVDEAVD